ncbi:MAG: hypothetical protein A2X86_14520 [Bdellovibrionales bacterium GWA2_49_15]|nr:MAG: hypothetical protein A2X86_14520 [Bdellovibrionales bacterium GWA2_49_15]HAZ13817.1 hypothetical protein [Bdellovibrionales bacterium]
MSPKLPIKSQRVLTDSKGRMCKIDVSIEQTSDMKKFPPDGKKCVFRVFREKVRGSEDFELVVLIDNHEPLGFHDHDKLPEVHDSRVQVHTTSWQEAWNTFDSKLKELLNGT